MKHDVPLAVRDELAKDFPRFSPAEYERRYHALRSMMDRHELDALVVYGDSGLSGLNQLNGHYISNYIDELASYVIFPQYGDPTLYISFSPDYSTAAACAAIDDVRVGGLGGSMATQVACGLKERQLYGKTIGIVANSSLSHGIPHYDHIELETQLPTTSFVEATSLFEEVKAVPTAEEMEWLRRGIDLTDLAWEALVDAVKPGVTEAELLGRTHGAYLLRGGAVCFTIVGSTPMNKPLISYPSGITAFAGQRALKPGDVILAEISASFYGYAGQCCCLVALGEPLDTYWELYEAARATYSDLCARVSHGAAEEVVMDVCASLQRQGFDAGAPLVHSWGTHLGGPEIGMHARVHGSGHFRSGQLIVVQPNPRMSMKGPGVLIGNLTQVTSAGLVPLHSHGTEFVVKNA